MHRSMLFSIERPPDANQTRHRTDVTQHQLPAKGVAHVLRSNPTRPDLDTVRRRSGNGYIQVQIRRHGRRRMWMSVKDASGAVTLTIRREGIVRSTLLDRFRRTRRRLTDSWGVRAMYVGRSSRRGNPILRNCNNCVVNECDISSRRKNQANRVLSDEDGVGRLKRLCTQNKNRSSHK